MKEVFGKPCVIGIIGDANEGKSNLVYVKLQQLQKEFVVNIYTYGLRNKLPNVTEIYSIQELEEIRNSIILLDEFQSLFNLEDRHMRKQIENTLRLIFHNNNVLVLIGLPDNFRKFISGRLDIIMFKKCTLADFVNGSTAKNIIMNYSGMERGSAVLNLKPNEVLIFDGKHYKKEDVPYVEKMDTKRSNEPILKKK